MIKTSAIGILIPTAAITLTVATAALAGAPFYASIAVGETGSHVAIERIESAFASLPVMKIDPVIVAAATRLSRGDLGQADCAGGTWPNIDPACTKAADGSRVSPVRQITIGDHAGVITTVLLRTPSPR